MHQWPRSHRLRHRVIVRNTLNLTKNINFFHFVESLEQRIRFWSHANYIMVYLCFFPHNVTRKTNDLFVDPVLVELEIIWFEEQKITRTYLIHIKKGLLKKLIKSNITGDNEKIAKTILCLFSFLLTCFNNLIVVCLGMIFTIINKTKSTLSYF